jgi:hypothetical protein
MGPIGCGSAAVSERSERTVQGYHRFRCRTCGEQFNERSAGSLNRTQYPSDVIALVVLWRLRYGSMRGFKCPGSAGGFCRTCDELRNVLRSRSRTNQQIFADYRRSHFLRRPATVLRVMEAA